MVTDIQGSHGGNPVEVAVPKGGGYINLTPAQVSKLATWRRLAYYKQAESTLPKRAVQVREREEVSALEDKYLRNDAIYMDNLLTREALHRMREFCLDSCAWHQEKSLGYVGAQLDDGFATPLLFQIAHELASALPQVFRHHRLRHAWAYKYDSELQEGIDAHADQAAVNVNFWITPDADNLGPDGGGLVIYKAVAPKEWDFEDFNNRGRATQIAELIHNDEYRNSTVNYRENRVVIFDSSLFHKTDNFKFRPGYKSRRINVTLLFGKRSESQAVRKRGSPSARKEAAAPM